jgi:pyruvate/2-oxoglutarate dehydrogenase complex dihydrolipoamide dehydrogenase (E3) component
MKRFDVIVTGGGPAGTTAAMRAAELGANVALIERKWLGGTCTNDGCVPTRVLAKTARLMRESEHFGGYGLAGQRPSVNLQQLLAYTRDIIQAMHRKKGLTEHLHRAEVRLFAQSGAARFADAHTLELGEGTMLEGEKIIICAGGHARRIAFPGSDAPGVLTHHDVWSLKELPGSIIIIGAAATGCQLASIFAAFGVKVCLLEVAPRILATEDELASQVMAEAFRDSGIEIITGLGGLERVESQQRKGTLKLWYKYQGQSQSRIAEAIIMAVGWVGNIEDLNLDAINVETERGYIKVNDALQTSVPHIFAAGDITGRMMLVQSANQEGRLAAENAVLGESRTYIHQIVPHGGFTDPEQAGVGLTESQARAVENDCIVATVPYAHLDRAVIDGHTDGFCKLIVSKSSHLILGAHVVGEEAVEIVSLAAAGMTTNMRVEQLAQLELAYPTYTAIIGLAAQQAITELSGTQPLAHWRSLGMQKNPPADDLR